MSFKKDSLHQEIVLNKKDSHSGRRLMKVGANLLNISEGISKDFNNEILACDTSKLELRPSKLFHFNQKINNFLTIH